MNKHTPAPWTCNVGLIVHANKGETFIAQCGKDREGYRLGIPRSEAEANALLMAAAPDLLIAAQDALADLAHYVSTHGPGPDRRLAALQAAIAKAEGL